MRMACRACGLDHKPTVRCEQARSLARAIGLVRNQDVTTPEVSNHAVTANCNHCVTKDQIIEGLRNQIAEMEQKGRAKPSRDRAAYMREYRKKPLGIAHG